MDYTVHGILQARILEWAAFPFSRGSFQPRGWTQVAASQADSSPAEPQGKPKINKPKISKIEKKWWAEMMGRLEAELSRPTP